ncbi:MAG: hypothetical protein ACFB3T_00835, partial [Geminicoccaceae bacterium]
MGGIRSHIRLSSHPPSGGDRPPEIAWYASDPKTRGPVIGSVVDPAHRNVIGVHAGAYGVYRALAIASGNLARVHKPDLTDTAPVVEIGPFAQWWAPGRMVSLDPFGAVVADVLADFITQGVAIHPT